MDLNAVGSPLPSIDIDGGSFLLSSGAPFAFSNSTTGYSIEHFNNQSGGINAFINRTMPSVFSYLHACSTNYEGSYESILILRPPRKGRRSRAAVPIMCSATATERTG